VYSKLFFPNFALFVARPVSRPSARALRTFAAVTFALAIAK
jgi:hypothetical protein